MLRLGRSAESVKLLSRVSGNSNIKLAKGHGAGVISMSGRDFLDTNVLVYAYDSSNPSKESIAQDLIRQAFDRWQLDFSAGSC